MKVTVITKAFYEGSLRKPGQELTVPDDFKASWFVSSGTSKAQAAKPKPPSMPAPVALSQMGKNQPKSFNEVHAGDPPAPAEPPAPIDPASEPEPPAPIEPDPPAPAASKRTK